MRATFIFFLVVFSFSIYAQQLPIWPEDGNTNIYCSKDGQKVPFFDESLEWIDTAQTRDAYFHCELHFYCFEGNPEIVAAIINNKIFNWDEEWLGNAKVISEDQVDFDWIDGPADYSEPYSMSRCIN